MFPLSTKAIFVGLCTNCYWGLYRYTSACAMYDAPLSMSYSGLHKSSSYQLRVVYGYDSLDSPSSSCQLRLIANDNLVITDYVTKPWPPAPINYQLPLSVTSSGSLKLTWNAKPGQGGSGRCTQLAEVWLLLIS
jgi:hypothetical protein